MYNYLPFAAPYICIKPQKAMTQINEKDYTVIADALLDQIKDSNYFNGTISYQTDDWAGELRVTLIIYREPLDLPDDPARLCELITDIVPVWWEFNTLVDGKPANNDFSWRSLKEYLL